ncbi:MAG: pantoate--beta-alanine ligase [bacterium]
MDIIRSLDAMQQYSLGAKKRGLRIGFVPTMGCLHEGHLSLVKLARARSDVVVLSIFVNPIQFLPGEDFARYPRPVERDEALCRETGVDIVFYPDEATMYSVDHSVYVEETRLSGGLCGSSRPGHFRGVTTIVAKLFNLVLPDVAVFGQKDVQQSRIIQRMVRDLNYPIDIILGPIVREVDGLALSSRNRYLSASERQDSVCLYHSLRRAEKMVKDGERSVAQIRAAMVSAISLSKSARIDYIEFVNDRTLQPVTVVEEPVLLALAVKIGATRLIDNVVLRPT